MTRIRNVRNTTKFKRSIKAISPVIATLLMIAIAVVASLVVYAWVSGYMGTTTTKAGKAIQIQSYAPTGTDPLNPTNLLVYVQNVGQGEVELSQTQSVYIDSNLVPISKPTTATIPITVGQTVELTVPLPARYQKGDTLNIKVTTTDGTFMTASGKGTSSTGGGSNTNTLTAPTVTAGSVSVNQGQSSSLTSSAVTTGTAPYTYQWLQQAPGTGSYSTIAGATSSSYSFVTTGTTTAGVWSFELRVTDSASATVTSAPATVTVNTVTSSPTVTIAPTGPFTMDVGQTKMFTATPSGGTGTLHYQWYVGAATVGTDSVSYTYTASGSSASITCKVTDSASPPVTSPASNAVTITVNAAMSTPSITPTGPLTLIAGDTQTFTLGTVTGGSGAKTNQWYLDGVAVSGETGTTYIYTAGASGSPHSVYCQVTDSASTQTSVNSNTVSITVNAAQPKMHVASITMSVVPRFGNNERGEALITILDASGNPVSGVSVSSTWTTSGHSGSSDSGTTGTNGQDTLHSADVGSGSHTYTVTITSVSLNGWNYDVAASVTTNSITG